MIVSNTSPIVNLAAINQIQLLNRIYHQIVIPEAVYYEIVVVGVGQPGSREVRELDWIITRKVANTSLLKALKIELDDGEAEAIALTLELNADLLLIDEKIGRSVAARFNLNYVGILGLLVTARHEGIITSIKPLLDDLRIKAGFWISDELYFHILEIANES